MRTPEREEEGLEEVPAAGPLQPRHARVEPRQVAARVVSWGCGAVWCGVGEVEPQTGREASRQDGTDGACAEAHTHTPQVPIRPQQDKFSTHRVQRSLPRPQAAVRGEPAVALCPGSDRRHRKRALSLCVLDQVGV